MPSELLCVSIFSLLCVCAAPAVRAQQPTGGAAPSAAAEDDTPAAVAQYLPSEVLLPGDGVDVPLDEVDDHPVVTVMINGRGPFRLGIETGSPLTVISPAVAVAAGVVASEAQPFGQYVIDSLAVGAVRIRNLPIQVLTVAGPGERSWLDGLLCLNAYYDVLLTLDYENRRVRFARSALPVTNGRDVLPLHLLGTLYGVDISVGSERHLALLDTQNGVGFFTTPDSIGMAVYATPPREAGAVTGPAVGSQTKRIGRLAGGIRIGDVTFAKPLVSLVPMPPGVPQGWNVGWSVLRNFVIAIDQKHRRLRLARPGKTVAAPPPEASTGLVVKMLESDTTAYTVVDVLPGSDAERQGVRAGDRLLSFDGMPATLKNYPAWRNCIRGQKPVHVVLQRGTETKRLALAPQVIVW